MTDPSSIKEQMESIHQQINKAQKELNNGESIDLFGLNTKVQDACRDVLTLPPAQAKEFQPIMASIISNLNRLEESLKAFHNELNELKDTIN